MGGVRSLIPQGCCEGSSDLDRRLSAISSALCGVTSRRDRRGVEVADTEEVGGEREAVMSSLAPLLLLYKYSRPLPTT